MKILYYKPDTKIEVAKEPKYNITDNKDKNGDPHPWLDEEDPRRTMTDEEILRLKVLLDKSVLTAAEKEKLIKLMLKNTQAFSIRDEIAYTLRMK